MLAKIIHTWPVVINVNDKRQKNITNASNEAANRTDSKKKKCG